MPLRTSMLKREGLDWFGTYAGHTQRHIMKTLYNINTKFHDNLSLASKVIRVTLSHIDVMMTKL
jgi:hypothetical protein